MTSQENSKNSPAPPSAGKSSDWRLDVAVAWAETFVREAERYNSDNLTRVRLQLMAALETLDG